MQAADSLAAMLARPIAHRGLHGCGQSSPIENTIQAALAAADAGYGVECDVIGSRDGTPIVIHDATLERLAGLSEAVADLGDAALAAISLKSGGSIPTLENLLGAIAGRTVLVVEIKGPADRLVVDHVLRLAQHYSGPIALESFDPTVLSLCRAAHCPIGLVGPGDTPIAPGDLERCDFASWNVARLGTAPADLPLTSWTVRCEADAARAAAAGAQIVFEGWRP